MRRTLRVSMAQELFHDPIPDYLFVKSLPCKPTKLEATEAIRAGCCLSIDRNFTLRAIVSQAITI
jgi:hypothetical protein